MSEKKTIRAGAVCLLVSLLAALFFTACVSKSVNAADKIELGQKYLTELNYTEAVAAFTEVIGLDPDNIEAYMGRAEAYKGLKQYDDAKADYTTAIEKTDEMPYTQAQAYTGRAEVYELTDESTAAESDYSMAIGLLDEEDVGKIENIAEALIRELKIKVLQLHAEICEKLGLYDKAMEDYAKLAELGVDVPEQEGKGEEYTKTSDDVVDSDSKYYLIACDYDGDGNEEAFAFTGAWNGENENWQELKLYYIHSDGQVEKIEMNDDVVGRPEKIADPEQNDFSDNLITLGDKTFLSFEIGSPSSEYQNVLLGSTGGQVTQSYLIGFPEKIDESHIAAEDLDNRIIYREENGIFIEVQRMPGEEYEDQFASREEYLSSMLSEKQLKELAADLGVPEDLKVRYTQGERSYWEAGGCWEIYVEIDADMKVVAASSVDAETGNLTQNILTYNQSGYWEVN